jgi:hypothetical protein
MPRRNSRCRVSFTTSAGERVSFRAKPTRNPARTAKELETRLRKLKSPKMRASARRKWHAARKSR